MQKFYLPPTQTSPEIHFSPDENIFLIRGISTPEDVREIYYPVIEWIRTFTADLPEAKTKQYSFDKPLTLQIDLAYFNSSSAKFLYDIFIALKKLKSSEIHVRVDWMYEEGDIDLMEAGADFASLVEMEFAYIQKPGITK